MLVLLYPTRARDVCFEKWPVSAPSTWKSKAKQLTYLDCVRTPMTSAYRSAMMCTLTVLGPEFLSTKGEKGRREKTASDSG